MRLKSTPRGKNFDVTRVSLERRVVPPGLVDSLAAYPALKRWAKFVRASGTAFMVRRRLVHPCRRSFLPPAIHLSRPFARRGCSTSPSVSDRALRLLWRIARLCCPISADCVSLTPRSVGPDVHPPHHEQAGDEPFARDICHSGFVGGFVILRGRCGHVPEARPSLAQRFSAGFGCIARAKSRRDGPLAESVYRIVLNFVSLQELEEFFFVAFGMMRRLVRNVFHDALGLRGADAEPSWLLLRDQASAARGTQTKSSTSSLRSAWRRRYADSKPARL